LLPLIVPHWASNEASVLFAALPQRDVRSTTAKTARKGTTHE